MTLQRVMTTALKSSDCNEWPPLSAEEIEVSKSAVPLWKVVGDSPPKLSREFKTKNFQCALDFINHAGAKVWLCKMPKASDLTDGAPPAKGLPAQASGLSDAGAIVAMPEAQEAPGGAAYRATRRPHRTLARKPTDQQPPKRGRPRKARQEEAQIDEEHAAGSEDDDFRIT